VTVTSTFAYSPLGSSVPVEAIAIVIDGEDGGGVGFGGGLAATVAVVPTINAIAASTATRGLRPRELIRLRIRSPPRCVEPRLRRSIRRLGSARFQVARTGCTLARHRVSDGHAAELGPRAVNR
jgi:hypothetical protein